jgi:hypothetical protein
MAQARARGRWDSATSRSIRVHPVRVTYWEKVEGKRSERDEIKDPAGDAGRKALEGLKRKRTDHEDAYTVWVEARLDGLERRAEDHEWLGGSLEAWDYIDEVPQPDWNEMHEALSAVGQRAPDDGPIKDKNIEAKLLNAIPYLYVQGAFATHRDVCSDVDSDDGSNYKPTDNESADIAAFPLVGFYPDASGKDASEASYTMVRTMVGLVDGAVVTVRLPDVLEAESGEGVAQTSSDTEKLFIPNRFLPLLDHPNGLDVATAIGIHQATTARSVAKEIARQLSTIEKLAEKLNALREDDRRRGKTRRREAKSDADLRKRVIRARAQLGVLSETTHQIDQQLARIMRRFGGSLEDAQRREGDEERLVPDEVRLRYKFALDDVRQLRDDCKIATERVVQALTRYDQDKRERFQLIAAVLASIVLIPTLFASLFGVNFVVPAKDEPSGFWVFVVVMAIWILEALGVLWIAQRRDWYLSVPARILAIGVALVSALAVIVPAVLIY